MWKLTSQLITAGNQDVAEMLTRYDSGMADRLTSNAIALAVKRILKPEHRVRVGYDRKEEHCFCNIDEYAISLPTELIPWLQAAECAQAVEAISFSVSLPKSWLLEPTEPDEKTSAPEQTSIAA